MKYDNRKIFESIRSELEGVGQVLSAADRIRDLDYSTHVNERKQNISKHVKELSPYTQEKYSRLIKELTTLNLIGNWYSLQKRINKILEDFIDEELESLTTKTNKPENDEIIEKAEKIDKPFKLPYKKFILEDKIVCFDENIDKKEAKLLSEYAESNWGEISKTLDDNVNFYVTNNPSFKSELNNLEILSINDFLNLTDFNPESFPKFIDALFNENFDISTYSNEGDGLLGSFSFESKTENLKQALLEFAKQSKDVEKIIASSNNRYSKFDLESKKDSYKKLFREEDKKGWYQFINTENFAWDIRAFNEEYLASGKSIFDTFSKFVNKIAVLEIHDEQIEESVDTIHICGGLDENNYLIGFILHRVWT